MGWGEGGEGDVVLAGKVFWRGVVIFLHPQLFCISAIYFLTCYISSKDLVLHQEYNFLFS